MKSKNITKNTDFISFFTILIIGIIVRSSFFIGSKFPLHDGGFFYVLVKDLIANNFALPHFSSYNNAGIPFIYPPFGIYLTAIIEKIFGVDRLQLLRWIPLLFSILTMPAFYLLSRELLNNNWTALASTACYSLLPLSYGWLILGGGVTRAPGSFFGILALFFVVRFINSGKRQNGLFSAVFCGLTVLSHPEWAWFIFYSIGVYVLIRIIQKSRGVTRRSCWILMGTLLVVSPWMITIIHLNGTKIFMPLLDSGFSRWKDISQLLFLNWSKEVIFPFLSLFGLISIFSIQKHKEWFIVLWFFATFFLQGRAADQKAVVPLAMIAGIGLNSIISIAEQLAIKKVYISLSILVIFIYTLVGSYISSNTNDIALSPDEISSLSWIKSNIAPRSKVLVITEENWVNDSYSEWMATLTDVESISLIQGYEWLPGFSKRIALHEDFQYAYDFGGITAVKKIADTNQIKIDYLVLVKSKTFDVKSKQSTHSTHWAETIFHPGVTVEFENGAILLLNIQGIDAN